MPSVGFGRFPVRVYSQGPFRGCDCRRDRTRQQNRSLFELLVWDLATGRCLEERPGHESKVMCVAISGNGNQLIAGDVRGYLSISDPPATGLRVVGPFARSIGSAKLSADGSTAYLGLDRASFFHEAQASDFAHLWGCRGVKM